MCHMSQVTCHMVHVTCHMSPSNCHMSHVTLQLSLTPTATDIPLLTPPLSTVDWFLIQKNLLKKRNKKHDTLAVINNYYHCDIHTHRHGDSMTDPAQRAKSVKNVKLVRSFKGYLKKILVGFHKIAVIVTENR